MLAPFNVTHVSRLNSGQQDTIGLLPRTFRYRQSLAAQSLLKGGIDGS
jgi:hypothetical protein